MCIRQMQRSGQDVLQPNALVYLGSNRGYNFVCGNEMTLFNTPLKLHVKIQRQNALDDTRFQRSIP